VTIIRCDHCNTPIMEVQGQRIIVKARHHGKEHISVVRIEELSRAPVREVAEQLDFLSNAPSDLQGKDLMAAYRSRWPVSR